MGILEENNALLVYEFESALIGYTNGNRIVAVYDYDKCVRALQKQNKWTHDEAVEWMEFNVVYSGMGESSPIFITITV
jgi:hypothetical protein